VTVVRRLADFRTEWCHQCECGGQQFLLVAAEHDAIVGTTGCLRCGKTQPADWVYDVAKDVLRDAVRDARRFDEHLTAWRDNNAWHAAEIDRLSAALAKYGEHLTPCARREGFYDDECACGLDAALTPRVRQPRRAVQPDVAHTMQIQKPPGAYLPGRLGHAEWCAHVGNLSTRCNCGADKLASWDGFGEKPHEP
jgi:hypothetical protein